MARSTKEEVKSGGAMERYQAYVASMQSAGQEPESPEEWKRKYYDTAISGGKAKEPSK